MSVTLHHQISAGIARRGDNIIIYIIYFHVFICLTCWIVPSLSSKIAQVKSSLKSLMFKSNSSPSLRRGGTCQAASHNFCDSSRLESKSCDSSPHLWWKLGVTLCLTMKLLQSDVTKHGTHLICRKICRKII